MFIAPEAIEGLAQARSAALARRNIEINGYTPYPVRMLLSTTEQAVNSLTYTSSYSSYLPERFVEKMLDHREWFRELRELNEARSAPVTVDGKQVTSRSVARKMLGEVVEDLQELSIMLFTSYITEEDPGKVTYTINTKVGLRERTVSLSKFFGRLNHKWKFRIPQHTIDEAAETMPLLYGDDRYQISLSDDIQETYDEKYFGSCMFNKDSTEFYDRQGSHVVQVMRITDTISGELAGRALVWHNVEVAGSSETVTMVDRIYPSDGGKHIKAAIKYATEEGWFHKDRQSWNSAPNTPSPYLRVAINDVGMYPYMDTFHTSLEEGDYLYHGLDSYAAFANDGKEAPHRSLFNWTYTDGVTPWDPYGEADYYDDDDDEDIDDDY